MIKKLFNKQQIHYLILYWLRLLLIDGNKLKNFVLVNEFFFIIKKATMSDPFMIISKSIKNVEPFCEVKNLKIKGVIRKVPVAIYPKRQKILAIKLLVINSKMRKEKTLIKKLSLEFLDVIAFTGNSLKNCSDFHKIAETNKIFIQYRN
jgi:small subunit ribosomal protein S7